MSHRVFMVRGSRQRDDRLYLTFDTTSVRWNRDGSRLAYVAGLDDGNSMLFVNGEPGEPWPQIVAGFDLLQPRRGAHIYWAGWSDVTSCWTARR